MKTSSQKPRRKITAQAMVEFALALPVLLLVVYGLLESGRLLFIYASVVTAARQAARYGSATGLNGAGTPYYDDCAGIQAAARRLEFIQRFASINIDYDQGPGKTDMGGCQVAWSSYPGHPANGDRIGVTVTAVYSPIVPLVPIQGFNIVSTSERTLLIGASIAVTNPAQGFSGGGTLGLSLSKKANKDVYSALGEQIIYDFWLQNTGTDPVVGPFTIHDDLLNTTFTCQGIDSTLQGGSSVQHCTNSQTYTIQMKDLLSPELQNHAVAKNGDGSIVSNQATYTITFLAKPHITLTKTGTAPQTIAVGEDVTYDFAIQNDGNTPLQGPFTISDAKVAALCANPPAALGMGETYTCHGTYALKNTDINAGAVNNTATASAMYGQTTITSAPASAQVLTPPLQLVLTVSPSSVTKVGDVVTYTYSLTNRTNSSMSNITVTDTRGANKLSCVSSLAAHATASCTHPYTVQQADLDSPTGSFANLATASAQGNTNSNQAGVNVTVSQTMLLSLAKTASPLTPAPAKTFTLPKSITYTYVLTNVGNVSLTAPFNVFDNKFTGAACTISSGTLAPNSSIQCTKAYPLTQPDLDNGSVTNTAYATALFGTQTITSPTTAAVLVITYTDPRLALVKTPSPAFYSGIDQQITYTYGLRNTGGQILTVKQGYTITDVPLGPVACAATADQTIAVGATLVCGTLTHTTTLANVQTPPITNSITGTGTVLDPNNNPVSPTNSPLNVSVPLFICNTQTLTHNGPTPIPDGSSATWTVNNNTGAVVHIGSIIITWNTGKLISLTQVSFGGSIIWGPGSQTTNLTVPGGPWALPPGSSSFVLNYSTVVSGIRIQLTFVEPNCNFPLDSNQP